MATNPLQYLLFLLPLIIGEETAEYNIVELNQLPTIYIEQFYSDVFSEMNVFYEPRSNIAVPLISKSVGNVEKNLFNRIYGSLPCVCSLGGCDCCVDIKIKLLNVLQNGCVKLRSLSDDNTAFHTELELNQQSIIQRRVQFDQTPPLCIPFPPFPAISICVRLTDIMRDGRNIKACVHFDLRITGVLTPLWTLQFTCVRFGFSGISWFQPERPPQALPQPNGFLFVSDPPPLCVPVPSFPFVAGCIHFNRIVTQNGNLKGCINLEFHVSGTEIVLWETQFSCFRIGMNGITFNRPNKKKKEKPGKQCSNEKPPKH